MTTTRRAVLAGGSLLTSAALLRDLPIAMAQPVDAGVAPEPAASLLETAVEAYVYGYPLVTMEMTRPPSRSASRRAPSIAFNKSLICPARVVTFGSPKTSVDHDLHSADLLYRGINC
jgi:hypothetical protein